MIKRRNICTRCGKSIAPRNKTGLCNSCYHYQHNKKRMAKWKQEHRCTSCGKPVKVLRCPYCKKVAKYYTKCDSCLKKDNETNKRCKAARLQKKV